MTGHPACAANSRLRGSYCSADTSFTTCAPAASAASIVAGRRVSTLIAAPIAAQYSTAGMTRLISSPSHVAAAPGRVLSPPISIIAAPASSMAAAWVRPASGSSRKSPPSEKLSGVTFRMPTTCGWSSRTVRCPSSSGECTLARLHHCSFAAAPAPSGNSSKTCCTVSGVNRQFCVTFPSSRKTAMKRWA